MSRTAPNWLREMGLKNCQIRDTATNGDCFFDAIAMALNARHNTPDIDICTLRTNLAYSEKITELRHTLTVTRELQRDIEKQTHAVLTDTRLTETKRQAELDKLAVQSAEGIGYVLPGDLHNLDTYREFLCSSRFWATHTTVGNVEEEYNVRCIVLSKDGETLEACVRYFNMQRANHDALTKYIILELNGLHYRLVTYRQKPLLQFREIDPVLKTALSHRYAKNSENGLMIPEFEAHLIASLGGGTPVPPVKKQARVKSVSNLDALAKQFKTLSINPPPPLPKKPVVMTSKQRHSQEWRDKQVANKLDKRLNGPRKPAL